MTSTPIIANRPPRIALLGADGQVGWELRRSLAHIGPVIALTRHSRHSDFGDLCGDLSRPQALAESLRRIAPDVVVNAAAYTAVDRAESEPDLARAVNAAAPNLIAKLMAERGGWLVHFSTDYVFDGQGNAPRTESDPTAPLSVYGHTKLEGEQAILASGCAHLILRTSWVHAARGSNFARTMLRLAAEREKLQVVDDQIGAPTGADLLADVAAHALHRCLREPALGGLYHLAASGETSWCGYARHVIGWAQERGLLLKATPQDVHPVLTRDYPSAAQRPLNSRLNTTRLTQTLNVVLPDWRHGVERMLTEALNLPTSA